MSSVFSGRMQGGTILASAMAQKGIKRVFALCGGFLNPVFDGCVANGIEVVGTRHEMEAGFMGSATSRLRKEPIVVMAEPSGFTNYISAIAEASFSNDPVIFIAINSIFHRRDHHGFKELPQWEIVRPMMKYAVDVTSGDRLHEYFDKAYDIAMSQPTGPVFLSIPINFVFSHYEFQDTVKNAGGKTKRNFNIARKNVYTTLPHDADVEAVANLIKGAKKPVFLAGSGVHQASAEGILQELCKKTEIPYFHANHLEYRAVDFTQTQYMGLADIHQNPASRIIMEESDVVVVLGAKMDYCLDFGQPPLFNADSKLICVNATSRELSDNHIADMGVMSDVRLFLEALAGKLEGFSLDTSWRDEIIARRKHDNEDLYNIYNTPADPIHPLQACVDILRNMSEKDYLVVDGGDAHGWQESALNLTSLEGHGIKSLMMSGPFAQLGVGTSFATAIKMADPESNVVVISGDGSFGLNPGLPFEIALEHNLPIVSVVLNNSAWGMINNQQKELFGGRICATTLRTVPFEKIIEATGGYAEKVTKLEELVPAFERARKSGKPALLNVITGNIKSKLTIGLVDKREKSSIE